MSYDPAKLKKALDTFESLQQKDGVPERFRSDMQVLIDYVRNQIELTDGNLSKALTEIMPPNLQFALEEAGIKTLHDLVALSSEELKSELREMRHYGSIIYALDAAGIPHHFEKNGDTK